MRRYCRRRRRRPITVEITSAPTLLSRLRARHRVPRRYRRRPGAPFHRASPAAPRVRFTRQNPVGCDRLRPPPPGRRLPRDIPAAAPSHVHVDLTPPVMHFRHSRKHSRVSGAHCYHTGPPCSGVLANKVRVPSRFPPPPPFHPSRPFFCLSFSPNAGTGSL